MPMFITRSRALVLYVDGNFRVWRDTYRRVYIQEFRKAGVYGAELSDATSYDRAYWHDHVILHNYVHEYHGSRSDLFKVNRKYAQRGKVWIDRFKELLAQDVVWDVMCNNWDGLGVACPLQVRQDEVLGCPVSFYYSGHAVSMDKEYLVSLPGKCPGPLNRVISSRRNVSYPSGSDCYGITMKKLADVRTQIRRRISNGKAVDSNNR